MIGVILFEGSVNFYIFEKYLFEIFLFVFIKIF